MCVAIVCNKGSKLPGYDTLSDCWESNPHGAGFAYRMPNGKVHILKGFMTFKEFYDAWERHLPEMDDTDVLVHFRIATHGGVYPGMCHPFPVSNKADKLKATDLITDQAMVHNGIISIVPRAKDWSDSAEFAAMLKERRSWMGRNRLPDLQAYKSVLGERNKVAVLGSTGIETYGTWSEYNGCLYSNLFWQFQEPMWRGKITAPVTFGKSQTKGYEEDLIYRRGDKLRVSGLYRTYTGLDLDQCTFNTSDSVVYKYECPYCGLSLENYLDQLSGILDPYVYVCHNCEVIFDAYAYDEVDGDDLPMYAEESDEEYEKLEAFDIAELDKGYYQDELFTEEELEACSNN